MPKFQLKTTLTMAIRAVLLGIPTLTCAVIASHSYADTGTHQLSIQKSTLDQALKQLAIQTGMTISYDAQAFSKIHSHGLQGQYSPEEALRKLLQPLALEPIRLKSGGFAIQAHQGTDQPSVSSQNTIPSNIPSNQHNTPSSPISSDQIIQLPTITVAASHEPALSTEETHLYTAQATTASTGLALSLKETPQLVSVMTRQQMEDQHLTQLTDVVRQSAGLTIRQSGNIGTDSSPIFARGQQVDNYLSDGIKLLSSYSSLFQSQDTAIFDRIEVVRGANGLMTGTGTAGASINMVRKKPLQDFKASVSADAGSWDSYRTDADLSTPLNQDGTIRGRVSFAYQDGNSYIDRYAEERKVAYGVLEADLSDQTKASVGLSYQQIYMSGMARSGLPSFYKDGSLIHWSDSDSAAADWTYTDRSTEAYFADIEHQLNADWKLKGTASRTITTSDEVVGYTFSAAGIDKNMGQGAMLYATRWDYQPTQDLFNLTLNGSFDLFNQTHDLVFGTTYTKSKNKRPSYSGWNNGMRWDGHLENIFTWDGKTPSRPPTIVDGWYSSDETSQSFFGTIRLKPIDDLAIILGTRVENWERISQNHTTATNQTKITPRNEHGEVIPYIGITYNLTPHWTGYANYTNVFSPQDKVDIQGNYLDPVIGNSTEIGIKGEFFDNQLNIGAALYQTEEDNKAIALVDAQGNKVMVTSPTGTLVQANRAESGAKSQGFEIEATGKLNDAWQISTSFTRNLTEDHQGNALNTNIPNNTAKLFTTYTLPFLNDAFTIGGGVRWQSEIYKKEMGAAKIRFTQEDYTVVDLMARYKVNQNLALNFNLNNVFNEKYFLDTGNSYYGTPTNVRVGLKYDW